MDEQKDEKKRLLSSVGERGVLIGGNFGGSIITGNNNQIIGILPKDIEDLPPEQGEAPYRGLRYFDEEHAEWFFGRERLTAVLVNRMHDTNFLAVVGDSGSGKSSVVRAGVVPVLTRKKQLPDGSLPPLGQWQVQIFTPTGRPLAKLADLLFPVDHPRQEHFYQQSLQNSFALYEAIANQPQDGYKRLIFVDQFEELFTLCKDEAQREAFIDNLLTVSSDSCKVIITLRADFYAQCAQYENLRQILQAKQEFIGAMNRREQAEAILRPAALGQWELQEKLVELILDDVGKEPGALPLMSHALLEMWQRRRGRVMTLSGYDEAGKVRGAIAQTAETTFRDLSEAEQQVARLLFLRLTELGEDIQDTRRRAGKNELGNEAIVQNVIDQLANARLITVGDENIDIAHEVLIHEWPRLRGWIDVDRQGQQIHRRLTNASQIWQEKGQESSYLYQGFQLDEAENWANHNPYAPNELELSFLEVSFENKKRQQEEEEEKRRTAETLRTQQKVGRVLRWATGIVVILLIIAIIAAIIANNQRGIAEVNKDIADTNANLASTREAEAIVAQGRAQASEAEVQQLKTAIQASQLALAAQADLSNGYDPERALLLAIASLQVNKQPDTQFQVTESLQTSYRTTMYGHKGNVHLAVFSPDEQTILTASQDSTARLWDRQGNELAILRGHLGAVRSAVFSPNGETVLTAGFDGTARLWDLEGTQLTTLLGHKDHVNSAVFSPDGKTILTASLDGTARLWNLEGTQLTTLLGHDGYVVSAVFSPNGKTILTASFDGTARLWDLEGSRLATFEHDNRVNSATFSSDGQTILTASSDETARLWDLQGNELAVLPSHKGIVFSAVFSPSGQTILTASGDGTARLWDKQSNELAILYDQRAIHSAIFSSDGQTILTASFGGTARLWDLQGNELAVLPGHKGIVFSAVFSPSGQTILTASGDGTARLWNWIEQGQIVLQKNGYRFNSTVLSPDGQAILTTSWGGAAQLWDWQGNELTIFNHGDWTTSAVFSPDGQTILTASTDGTTRLWDLEGNGLAIFKQHDDWVNSAVFSSDEQTILTASNDDTARLWDRDGNELAILRGHTSNVNSAMFSSDDQTILTASADSTARLWDRDGNELAILHGHTSIVNSAMFSPDEQTILTASDDGTLRLWDRAGNELAVSLGNQYFFRPTVHNVRNVYSAVFSPYEQTILTAHGDGTVHLWNWEGSELAILLSHKDTVSSAMFSPDGQTILTASWDGTARLWPSYTIEYMVQEAFWRIKRGFTEEECQQYFRDDLAACPHTKEELFAPLAQYLSPSQQAEWGALP